MRLATEQWAMELITKMMKVPPCTLDRYSSFLGADRLSLLRNLHLPYQLLSRSSFHGQSLHSYMWEDLGLNGSRIMLIPDTQTHFVVEENPVESTKCIVRALDTIRNETES